MTNDAEKQYYEMVGRRLRSIRTRRGMTLKEVATKMLENDGLTENHPKWGSALSCLVNKISRNETAIRVLKYPFANELATVLDFDVDMLLSRNEVNLDSLTQQRPEHSINLSAELIDALETARKKIEEDTGIHSLTTEQLIEHIARKYV